MDKSTMYYRTNLLIHKEVRDVVQNILDNLDCYGPTELDIEMLNAKLYSSNEWIEHYEEILGE